MTAQALYSELTGVNPGSSWAVRARGNRSVHSWPARQCCSHLHGVLRELAVRAWILVFANPMSTVGHWPRVWGAGLVHIWQRKALGVFCCLNVERSHQLSVCHAKCNTGMAFALMGGIHRCQNFP